MRFKGMSMAVKAAAMLSGGKPFDYYVDSVNGNDANDGLTQATALKTISAVTPLISSNKRIGLAKGSTWHEQLTIPNGANNVIVKTYGAGNKPMFDCSDPITNADFTKTVGQTNVYQATVTHAAHILAWKRVWEDNVGLVRAADLATCDATPGSYFPSADATSPITLYVHASDSSDVSANGKVYEHNTRLYGFDCRYNMTGCSVEGIQARRNLHNDGSINLGVSCNATDCDALEGTKHNFFVNKGCTLVRCTAQNSYYGTAGRSLFVLAAETPAGENVTFIDCAASNATPDTLCGQFWMEVVSGGNYGIVTYTNCSATNGGTGFAGSIGVGGTRVVMNNCNITDCAKMIQLSGTTPVWVVTGGTWTALADQPVYLNAIGANLTISGVTMTDLVSACLFIYATAASVVADVTDCVFISGGTSTPVAVYFTGASVVVNFQRNRVVTGMYGALRVGTGYTVTSDYNTIGAAIKFRPAATWLSLADWRTLSGQDMHTTTV